MPLLSRVSTFVLALGLLVACNEPAPPRFPHAVMTPAAPIALPAVDLIGPDGKAFRTSSLAGRWVWLYFGFTNCPDVCPVAMDYMAGEYKHLKRTAPVQVLFVSVDPRRDDPKKLATFAHFHNPAFMGVTGEQAALETLTKALAASYVIEKPKQPGGDYGVSHTNLIFLIDPQGRHVATYVPGANPGTLADDTDALTQKEPA
jgi:protein SCO1/2